MADRRFMTPGEVAAQQAGATSLAPGVWMDAKGHMHFSVPDLLRHFGLDDTKENRDWCMAEVRRAITADVPDAEIVEQDLIVRRD